MKRTYKYDFFYRESYCLFEYNHFYYTNEIFTKNICSYIFQLPRIHRKMLSKSKGKDKYMRIPEIKNLVSIIFKMVCPIEKNLEAVL